MKKLIFIFFIISFQQIFSQGGSSGLKFLYFCDSRLAGLGESGVSTSANSSAVFGNPALLGISKNSEVKFGIRKYIQDINDQFILAKSELFENFSLGFHLLNSEVPDIEVRLQPGEPLEKFDSKHLSTGLTFAYQINNELSLGLTAKYLFEKIFIDESSGIGFDIGSSYRPIENLLVGISINNFGFMSEFLNEKPKLPTTISFGGNYLYDFRDIDLSSLLILEFHNNINDKQSHLSAGLEVGYSKLAYLRLGYITGYDSKGLTTGLGLRYSLFNLAYSFIPYSMDLGSSHTLTLGLEF